MHAISVPANTTIGSANSQITVGGPGSLLGVVIALTTGSSIVGISDEPNGANSKVLLPAGLPAGAYVFPINAISRTGNWFVSTSALAQLLCTVARPSRSI